MSPFLVLLPGVRPSEPMLFGKPRDKFLLLGANRDDQRARAARFGSVNASTREKKCRNSKGENVGLSRDSDNISNSAFITKSPP